MERLSASCEGLLVADERLWFMQGSVDGLSGLLGFKILSCLRVSMFGLGQFEVGGFPPGAPEDIMLGVCYWCAAPALGHNFRSARRFLLDFFPGVR